MATVLVVGSGCREHVLAWKLSTSPKVSKVIVAPGNGGTYTTDLKITSLDLNIKDIENVASWCVKNKPSLVVVGPEDPLNSGLCDRLKEINQPCFGPSKAAAQIECDKGFAKNFMERNKIPTAKYKIFSNSNDAQNFIMNDDKFNGYVVKATGLAAGKGVVVAKNRHEACQHVKAVLEDKRFGSSEVVVEELLQGYEVSLFVFSDGINYSLMLPAQDFKRAYDGDKGPNTGGMGSICPVYVKDNILRQIEMTIIKPTLQGMKNENRPFVGVLYAGLMITPNGPKVIEFNCRFGDPETQTVLPLLKSDLFTILQACADGNLNQVKVDWYTDKCACGVVIASENYPSTPNVGREINGLDDISKDGLLIFHGGTKRQQNGTLVSSGGRVLTVVSVDNTLPSAVSKAISGAGKIKLQGSFYRKDIGAKEVARILNDKLTYKASGVDIEAGEALVDQIKLFAPQTNRPGVMESLGGFGALFDLSKAGYRDPILVSGTDGVGTKLVIALEYGKFDTIGIDLVAMCVNDILVQGAEPLFFLDYFACGKLDVTKAASIVKSIADGCAESGCALIGGETAEMPDMYHDDDFDLAGFAVGAVERKSILPLKEQMKEGDILIGISSSGVHSNGYSLVRKIVSKNNLSYKSPAPFDPTVELGQILLTPTKLYVKPLLPLVKKQLIKGMAHITGGGLTHNIPRILPSHLSAHLDANNWPLPPVFKWISKQGPVSSEEMLQTFNCGLGMICIVSQENSQIVLNELKESSLHYSIVGSLQKRQGNAVIVKNFLGENDDNTSKKKKRVAVLISGSGTNLQALIDYEKNNCNVNYELALVISNVKDAYGLERARKAGINTQVISHIGKKRLDFDMEVNEVLKKENIQLVCLAGFMRIISPQFVRLWSGKLINIHPSLLPLFKGLDTHEQALEAGVRIHGCTVHFVDEGVDTGGIIMQKSVQIFPGDTKELLQERVKTEAEHSIYPLALDYVAKGLVKLDPLTKKVIWASSEE